MMTPKCVLFYRFFLLTKVIANFHFVIFMDKMFCPLVPCAFFRSKLMYHGGYKGFCFWWWGVGRGEGVGIRGGDEH